MTLREVTKYAGTVASDDAVGSIEWSDPENAQGEPDNSPAKATGAGVTEWLLATGYSFAIPNFVQPLSAWLLLRRRTNAIPIETTERFSATGAHEFTVPAGVAQITVELWGAGGSVGVFSGQTGGAQGGAYARSVISVEPLSVHDVFVGSASIGNDGESSTFDTDVVVAAGGGGLGSSSSFDPIDQIAESTGDVVQSGGGGGAREGISSSNGSGAGGGGGAGGPTGDGADGSPGASGLGGAGGSGNVPGADGRDGSDSTNNGGSPPAPADAPGAGAGGTPNGNTSGALGGHGEVRITYDLPGTGSVVDDAVRLVVGGSVQSSDYSRVAEWDSGAYRTDTYGPIDISALSVAQVNASVFGGSLSALVSGDVEAALDAFGIRIAYDIAVDVTVVDPSSEGTIAWSNATAEIEAEIGGTSVTIDRSRWRIYADAEGDRLVYDSGLLTSTALTHAIGSGTPALPWSGARDGGTYWLEVYVREDGSFDGAPIEGTSALHEFSIDASMPAVSGLAVEPVTKEEA